MSTEFYDVPPSRTDAEANAEAADRLTLQRRTRRRKQHAEHHRAQLRASTADAHRHHVFDPDGVANLLRAALNDPADEQPAEELCTDEPETFVPLAGQSLPSRWQQPLCALVSHPNTPPGRNTPRRPPIAQKGDDMTNELFNQKITAVIAQALAQLSHDDPQEYARRLALGPGVYAQPQADCVRFTWHGPLAEVDLSLLTDDSVSVDDLPAPVWLSSCPDDIGELDEG